MSKKIGELGELEFLVKASRLGLFVSIPYGDNQKYDFIIDNGTQLLKIQVKTCSTGNNGVFGFCTSHGRDGKTQYRDKEIDYIACFIMPEGIWYIIPPKAVGGAKISLRPLATESKYNQFIEAWDLLLKE